MAGALAPVLKGVYICDDVIGNPVGGKPMIVNLWNAMHVPQGETTPYTLKKLCVFVWLRGGRGKTTFRIEIVRCDTGERLGRARFFEHEFTNPNETLYGRFMLENVTFPVQGEYTVEFFSNGVFFDDQPIRVIPSGG